MRVDPQPVARKGNRRLKCRKCRRWMAAYITNRTPLLRADPPLGSFCVECAPLEAAWRNREEALRW